MSKINTLDTAARKKLMERLRKLLAMAASNSPAEAAIALDRAQRLMAEYGLTQTDIDASAVETERTRTHNRAAKATRYDGHLAQSVAHAFACRLLRSTEWAGSRVSKSEWEFVGIGPSAKIAAYAYAAMRTQLTKARTDFLSSTHYKTKAQGTMLADRFCEGWVAAATRTITAFAGTVETKKTLDTSIQNRADVNGEAKSINRKAKPSTAADIAALRGMMAGKDSKLHHGVNGQFGEQLLIGGAA